MMIIALLIFISLFIAIVFLVVFFLSVKTGQYDDTDTPAMRMLFEDKPKSSENGEST